MNVFRNFLLLTALLFSTNAVSAHAQNTKQVIITEVMYHPPSATKKAEFIELYNANDVAVDLTDWCFEGVVFCFAAETTIEPHSYFVIARSALAFAEAYAMDANATYAGKLSNAGETLTLRDENNVIIDSISYLDQSPWPSQPDGSGDSLSLADLNLDNANAYNWLATAPSPGSANPLELESLLSIETPLITFDEQPTLTVTITNADSAELRYVTNFEAPTTIALTKTASSNTFTARLPALDPGALLRYRITATQGAQQVSLPRNTPDAYVGQVVPQAIDTNIPVLHLFENETQTVLSDGNQIWENVTFSIRGRASQEFPRKNYKVELAKGDEFKPEFLHSAVDEFALQGSGYEPSYLRQFLAWEAVNSYGLPDHQVEVVRVHVNGEYFGLFTFLEMPDGMWRDRHGLAEHAVYKAIPIYEENRGVLEKRTRLDEDWQDIETLTACIETEDQTALRNCLDTLVDVPQVINELAVMSTIRQADQGFHNFYLYYDVTGNQRWQLLPWDLDLTYGRQDRNWNIGGPRTDLATVHNTYTFCPLCNAILQIPDYEQAYLRRLRTIAEDYYADDVLEQRVNRLLERIAPELALEREIWEFEASTAEETQLFFNERFVGVYQENLLSAGSDTGTVPNTQQEIEIAVDPIEVMYTEEDLPYIEVSITNLSAEWLDISGWEIGHSVVIKPGNTIAPQQTITITDESSTLVHDGQALLQRDPMPAWGAPLYNWADLHVTDRANNTLISMPVTDPRLDLDRIAQINDLEPIVDQVPISRIQRLRNNWKALEAVQRWKALDPIQRWDLTAVIAVLTVLVSGLIYRRRIE